MSKHTMQFVLNETAMLCFLLMSSTWFEVGFDVDVSGSWRGGRFCSNHRNANMVVTKM